jgi:vitamin B12 transporter
MAYGLNFIIKSLVFLCVLHGLSLNAQKTVSLTNVEVTALKLNNSAIGRKTETIDSLVLKQFRFNSLAEVLSANTPIFIKSYGPGGLATTAFRGGNAAQTAVLWNGFNLQNAMLGQSDLALLPSFLFDRIDIEYGGSSSLWGSGAVGGSIQLNNNLLFNKGFQSTTNLGVGSYGARNGSIQLMLSKKRFVTSTKIYGLNAQNNFSHKDANGQTVSQKNAAYNFVGWMQELKLKLASNQTLLLNAWVNQNNRRLPAADPSVLNKVYQLDQALRLTADWAYQSSGYNAVIKAASFTDKINYSDSLVSLFSRSVVRTFILENENYINWADKQQLNFGVNVSSSTASASNYIGQKNLSRVSFLAGNSSSFLEGKLKTLVSGRAEYFSVGKLPITGNFSLDFIVFKGLTLKASGAKVYRQPTLNDLYWNPGGNSDLKPEEGYTTEGEIVYKKQMRGFSFLVSGAGFSKKINNWILWLPKNSGNPSPVNVQQVWSRGTETRWKVSYLTGKLSYGINATSSYVLSTTQANKQENNNTLNKQLIYTPRYVLHSSAFMTYKGLTVFYFHQYVGYRFITSDNQSWLSPYQLSSIKLNYEVLLKNARVALFANCNNLFNRTYNVIANSPMPLRNYEIGISIQTQSK